MNSRTTIPQSIALTITPRGHPLSNIIRNAINKTITLKNENQRLLKSIKNEWFGLVGWVLWHINLCRLFNAKSIFMQIVSSISNNSV